MHTPNPIVIDPKKSHSHWPQVSLLERDAIRVYYTLSVNSDLIWFDGHFPNQPVLPGITQTHWACLLSKEQFAIESDFSGFKKLKFQTPILPGQDLTLELRLQADKRAVSFTYADNINTFSSGILLFHLTAAE